MGRGCRQPSSTCGGKKGGSPTSQPGKDGDEGPFCLSHLIKFHTKEKGGEKKKRAPSTPPLAGNEEKRKEGKARVQKLLSNVFSLISRS